MSQEIINSINPMLEDIREKISSCSEAVSKSKSDSEIPPWVYILIAIVFFLCMCSSLISSYYTYYYYQQQKTTATTVV